MSPEMSFVPGPFLPAAPAKSHSVTLPHYKTSPDMSATPRPFLSVPRVVPSSRPRSMTVIPFAPDTVSITPVPSQHALSPKPRSMAVIPVPREPVICSTPASSSSKRPLTLVPPTCLPRGMSVTDEAQFSVSAFRPIHPASTSTDEASSSSSPSPNLPACPESSLQPVPTSCMEQPANQEKAATADVSPDARHVHVSEMLTASTPARPPLTMPPADGGYVLGLL